MRKSESESLRKINISPSAFVLSTVVYYFIIIISPHLLSPRANQNPFSSLSLSLSALYGLPFIFIALNFSRNII